MDAGCYINGEWIAGPDVFQVTDPATGEVVGTATDASPEQASSAVDAASAAFDGWAGMPAKDRGDILRQVTEELAKDAGRIADLIVQEQGKPLAQAQFEAWYAGEWLKWFAEEGRRTYGRVIPTHLANKRLMVIRQPVGVTVAITPWNFPIAMIARKIAPALAAGCTVVVKPAEQTPLSPAAFFEVLDRAGLPAGVVNLVTASDPVAVAPALLDDERVRKITFTGSTEVGKLLVERSAQNLTRVSLELGGHAPFIVFDDADLDDAITGLLASKFQVNGQSCLCANRIYVQDGVADKFTELLTAAVSDLAVGRGSDPDVSVGPLIDEPTLDKVTSHVSDALDKGASLTVGGGRLDGDVYDGGLFFAPTVLDGVTDDMLIAREETFGPVAPLLSFSDEKEVIERANASRYGLAAYFYTQDLRRSQRVAEALEYGMIGINDPNPATPSAPFGGMKESGLGREGGEEGIDAFLESKLVSMTL